MELISYAAVVCVSYPTKQAVFLEIIFQAYKAFVWLSRNLSVAFPCSFPLHATFCCTLNPSFRRTNGKRDVGLVNRSSNTFHYAFPGTLCRLRMRWKMEHNTHAHVGHRDTLLVGVENGHIHGVDEGIRKLIFPFRTKKLNFSSFKSSLGIGLGKWN